MQDAEERRLRRMGQDAADDAWLVDQGPGFELPPKGALAAFPAHESLLESWIPL